MVYRKRKREVDIARIEQYYTVADDGMVWSKIRDRWLKPQVNSSGYVFYFISYGVDKPCWMFSHTLVALKYIGLPPSPRHEIHHIDGNRMDNNYHNLAWVTHSENQQLSYADGRKRATWWLSEYRVPATLETRMKMSNAKKKRVRFEFQDNVMIYESIDDACSQLDTYRKKIYLCIKGGKSFKGGYLSFIGED
jgi:hypothetical protein